MMENTSFFLNVLSEKNKGKFFLKTWLKRRPLLHIQVDTLSGAGKKCSVDKSSGLKWVISESPALHTNISNQSRRGLK